MNVEFWKTIARNWRRVIDDEAAKNNKERAISEADKIVNNESAYSLNPLDDLWEDDDEY